MKFTPRGFTIVEIIIVIIVIGILASVTIVGYRGAQDRAEYARAQSDMKNIYDAITIYKSQKGAYPAGNGSFQNAKDVLGAGGSGDLTGYIDNLAILNAKTGFSYIYRADTDGTDYKLLRIKGTTVSACTTLPSVETGSDNSLLASSGTCTAPPARTWGYWSDPALSW